MKKKKQGNIIGHLKSNVKLSPQHFQWSRHYERSGKNVLNGALKKGVRHWHLPFSGLCVELSLFFFLIKKNTIPRSKIPQISLIDYTNTT